MPSAEGPKLRACLGGPLLLSQEPTKPLAIQGLRGERERIQDMKNQNPFRGDISSQQGPDRIAPVNAIGPSLVIVEFLVGAYAQ